MSIFLASIRQPVNLVYTMFDDDDSRWFTPYEVNDEACMYCHGFCDGFCRFVRMAPPKAKEPRSRDLRPLGDDLYGADPLPELTPPPVVAPEFSDDFEDGQETVDITRKLDGSGVREAVAW